MGHITNIAPGPALKVGGREALTEAGFAIIAKIHQPGGGPHLLGNRSAAWLGTHSDRGLAKSKAAGISMSTTSEPAVRHRSTTNKISAQIW